MLYQAASCRPSSSAPLTTAILAQFGSLSNYRQIRQPQGTQERGRGRNGVQADKRIVACVRSSVYPLPIRCLTTADWETNGFSPIQPSVLFSIRCCVPEQPLSESTAKRQPQGSQKHGLGWRCGSGMSLAPSGQREGHPANYSYSSTVRAICQSSQLSPQCTVTSMMSMIINGSSTAVGDRPGT